MATYFVHEPPDATGNAMDRAERLVFVKDGFSWLAALVPVIWLLMKRMWLELIVFVAGSVTIVTLLSAAGAANTATGVLLIIQIVLGFEAGHLYSASLERRGWRLVGTVSGRSQEDCERRFFETWMPTRTEVPESVPAAPLSAHAAKPETPSWSSTAYGQAKSALTGNPFAKASG